MLDRPHVAQIQASYSAHRYRLLLLQFESLTIDSAAFLRAIYEFIGEHHFVYVDVDVREFDQRAGKPGLQTLHPRVREQERQTFLASDLFNLFHKHVFWQDEQLLPPHEEVD